MDSGFFKTLGISQETAEKIIAAVNEREKCLRGELEAEARRSRAEAALETELAGARSLNNKAVRALLDWDSGTAVISADGTVEGLREKIAALRSAEDSRFLFGPDPSAPAAPPVIRGACPGERGADSGLPDTLSMGYSELCELYKNKA